MEKSVEANNTSIGEIVRKLEQEFISGGGTLMSKYVVSDLYEDISKIYAYLNSKHTTGDKDSLGRDKPFFNIVLAARNITFRATDIDRKNIEVVPTKLKHTIQSFVATVILQNWMRKENFGQFLNDWGLDLAGFNSSVVKFVESEGKLHSMVVPWGRLIVDPINFGANPIIEVIELTESELYQRKGYDKDMVEKLCDALSSRELTDRQKQDQKNNYIKLYEVQGNLPLSLLTGKDKDQDTYVEQMHVISFVASKEKGKFDDFTLISGRRDNPYMLTGLLPATDGSISLDGAVKNLFEAQWMMNHTVKSIKDQLDLASKLIFQTSDSNFLNQNVLFAIETGDILIHSPNQPLTQVNNTSHDITSQQNFSNMWKGLSNEISGISESMLGMNPPSGTAWRQTEALLAESHSLFELMNENKGLYIEQMLRRFVIPYVKKQIDNADEISGVLEAHNVTKIDTIYLPREAVKRFNARETENIIQGKPAIPFDMATEQQPIKEELNSLGNQRFFVPSDVPDETWKEILKDLEWELEINITGEAKDKQAVLTTLNTALQVIVNPAFANNPKAQLVVDKILQATGQISPIELSALPTPLPQTLPINTQVGAV